MTIYPSTLKGEIVAPPSKSVMQRACAAALLRKGSYVLRNAGHSDDDEVMLSIIQQMGCTLEETESEIRIVNDGLTFPDAVHFGESGLAARMMMPLLATHDSIIVMDAADSLKKRPMKFYEDVLPQLGVDISLMNGHLPGTIKGPLAPKTIEVDASHSSQTITGLIYAYSLAGASDVSIALRNLVSRPYVELTLDVLEKMGVVIPVWKDGNTLYWKAANAAKPDANVDFTIEGDWSSAAFLLAAGTITGQVTIRGLDVFTAQADKAILQALMDTGAGLSIQQEQIVVRSAGRINPFHFNATDCPDLFPPLAAMAAYANGTSAIEGVSRLIDKESNRAMTLQQELGKMGIGITLQDDLMIIEGGGKVKGAQVSSHGDHRIAMACAIAALGAEGPTTIQGKASVNKSYPNFWKDLQSLGAQTSTTV